MPSDDRVTSLLEKFAPQRSAFRSAVTEAAEQLRATLSSYQNAADSDTERAAVELGRFARGRIDPALFAFVFGNEDAIDADSIGWIDRADAVLREVASTTHLLQHARVQPGASLRKTVDEALARIGRGFGAVRIAEYARSGQPIREQAQYLDAFPYRQWSRVERRIALPLVVEVDGADLDVSGLEQFMDGGQIIVLLVEGDAPLAALVRLITPNVVVVQSTSVDDAALVAAAGGPAILAIVPETCAQFVHDRNELVIKQMPMQPRLRSFGSIGTFQQREELLQLERLAAPQLAVAEAEAPVTEPQPDDVLAAWLLRQADFA